MKIGHVNLPSIEECKKLPTPRLLTLYKKHTKLRHYGVVTGGNLIQRDCVELNTQFNQYLDQVKAILNTRENC